MIQRAPTTATFFSEEDKGTRRKTLYESSGASITIDTAGQNDLTFPRLDLCCKSRPSRRSTFQSESGIDSPLNRPAGYRQSKKRMMSRCAQIECHRYNEASMRLKGGIAAMALRQAEGR
jgi:hypothetical protein